MPGPEVVPTEKVNLTAEPVSNTQEQSADAPLLHPVSPLPLISEVTESEPTPVISDSSNDTVRENEGEVADTGFRESEGEQEDNTIDGDTGRYVLPPRSNRGVPPKPL